MSVVILYGVDGANARVVQLRGGACFALEAVDCLALVAEVIGDERTGDVTTPAVVFCTLDDTPPPPPQPSHAPQMGQPRSDHW